MEASERHSRAMASDVHVIVVGDQGEGLIDDALGYLDRLEQVWSRFLPSSDITRLNLSEGRAVSVAPETLVLLDAMADARRVTTGRFDPTVLPALIANGYAASITDPGRVTTVAPTAVCGGPMPVVDHERSTVTMAAGAALDPGGIGKGLAADLLVARLLAGGAAGALVGIGGDVAMDGRPADEDGWLVTIERPDPADGDLLTMAVDSGGVATSSTRSRRWTLGARERHHLIDPARRGQAETDLAAVTVVARTGWLAEAHATAALLGGREGLLPYLDTHDLSGLGFATDGTIVATADLDTLLVGAQLDPVTAR